MIRPDQSVDVVGVYLGDFTQVFPDAHQLSGRIIEDAQLMEQPLETGAVTVDHRIINPVEIQLTVALSPGNYRNAYQQIKGEFLKGTLFMVKTRSEVHVNMALSGMPREETAIDADLISMVLQFKEVFFQKAQFRALPPKSVAKKTNSSTAKRGEQTSKRDSGSTLYRTIFK